MDALNYIIKQTQIEIPDEIISLVNVTGRKRRFPMSNAKFLKDLIVNDVLIDLDLMRGVEVAVRLSNCEIVSTDDYGMAVRIPPKYRNYKPIVSVLSFTDNVDISDGGLMNMVNDSIQADGTDGTSDIDIIEDDLIYIRRDRIEVNATEMSGNYTIRFLIGYSDRLNEINRRTLPKLSEFVILGVKRSMRTKLLVSLGDAAIYHGHEIPVINRIIDEYESANEEYKLERKSTMRAVLYANDRTAMHRYIRMIT